MLNSEIRAGKRKASDIESVTEDKKRQTPNNRELTSGSNSKTTNAATNFYSKSLSYLAAPLSKIVPKRALKFALNSRMSNLNTALIDATDVSLLQNAFHDAVRNGRIDEISRLIHSDRVCVNKCEYSDGSTPLHIVAWYSYPRAIRPLVTAGADAKAFDGQGRTPLRIAAQIGNAEVISALITEGRADVNAVDPQGYTPLHIAADKGHTQAIVELIKHQANVNAVDRKGCTPLHLAVIKGHLNAVSALVIAGANVNAVDQKGKTPLHRASNRYSADLIKALITEQVDLNVASYRKHYTPLHYSARRGYLPNILALITAGADVNAVDQSGDTHLHIRVRAGCIGTVRALITAGANVNAIGQYGITPLHIAAQNGYIDIVRTLITADADVNVMNIWGSTPIVSAFEHGRHDVVTLLQQHGARLPEYLRQQGDDINGKQSVHEVSVHVSVSNSARSLKEYYPTADLASARQELITWAISLAGDDRITQAAKRCVARLKGMDFLDDRSGISMQDALGLVWLGINDLAAQENDLPKDTKITELKEETRLELIAERRTALLKVFYEIQRGYNINGQGIDNGAVDASTCVSGSFNKLVAALGGGRHAKVHIYFVTPKTITKKLLALVNQAFEELSVQQKRAYARDWDNEDSPNNSTKFFEKIKQGVQKQLKAEFAEFKAEVKDFDQVIRDNMDALESLPTPKNVKEWQEIRPGKRKIETDTPKESKRQMPNSAAQSFALFQEAAANGQIDVIKRLITDFPDVNAVDPLGNSPLHMAARNGHSEVVRWLISAGANVNVSDKEGCTPLHQAAFNGHSEVISALISAGANVNGIDNRVVTPIELASKRNHNDMVLLLQQHGACLPARSSGNPPKPILHAYTTAPTTPPTLDQDAVEELLRGRVAPGA